jgi:type IV secretion system protein VirB10
MRILGVLVLLSSCVLAQEGTQTSASSALTPRTSHAVAREITIPAGTKVPIALRNAISTKSSHAGDPVYAQTTFPVVIDEHIVIPAGTYMQGRISSIKPAGRIKGRAEVLMHFTTLIYPSGYTVVLPGSLEDAPAVDKARVKDKEGTIRADNDKGQKAATVAVPASEGGALAGGLATGSRGGALAGAGIGAAVGVVGAMLTHGNEVKLMPGTTLEVVMQRDVPVDASRVRRSGFAERE